MNICLLQTSPAWGDAAANMAEAGRLMDAHAGADLYVLPEMWATGFVTRPDAATARSGREALAWMKAEARRRGACIAGSLALPVGDGGEAEAPTAFTNTFVAAKADGTCPAYDKRHLFGYGGEQAHYRAGTRRVVTTVGGVRVLLQVCYDLRFPVFARNRGDYDLAVYVASWPESRQAVWDTLLRARAIENQCYVAGVNRVGDDPACHYAGGTALIDPYGRTVAAAPEGVAAIAGRIDMARLADFRRKFDVLADADDFGLTGVTTANDADAHF